MYLNRELFQFYEELEPTGFAGTGEFELPPRRVIFAIITLLTIWTQYVIARMPSVGRNRYLRA